MPHRHEQFIIAIVIIATLWLPLFSDASVENIFRNASNSFIVFGSKIDQSILFTQAIPSKIVHTLATTIDRASESVITAVEDGARSAYHVSRHAYRQANHARKQTLPAAYTTLAKLQDTITKQSAKLHTKTQTLFAIARQAESLSVKALQATTESLPKQFAYVKNAASSLSLCHCVLPPFITS